MRSAVLLVLSAVLVSAQSGLITVRPREIDDVLVNPGIGFMTFQRFNGDELNEGLKWTEGYPIVYQPYRGTLENKNHPLTSIAYFRVYWRFLEPEQNRYRFDLIDRALMTARERRQTLMLRVAPYGTTADNDVPDWYRALVGPESATPLPEKKWRVDPEDRRYPQYFGRLIRALGERYDGHPDLESVDVSIVGAWGEGAGSHLLTDPTRRALLDAYLDTFTRTPLVMLLADPRGQAYAHSRRPVGWRADCLGDVGGFSKTWNHMHDYYPQSIVNFGLADAWKKAPVTLEVCWVMQKWFNEGWDVDYIIDQSLKWHISSFNGKSSAVPEQWWPQVNRWLKRMGYRFVLRKFTFPERLSPNAKLAFTSWWENKGVAPPYRQFPMALRLKNASRTVILTTSGDIRTWLPGDVIYDDSVFLPADLAPGDYDLALALVDPDSREPKIQLAIAGRDAGGWYPMGTLKVGP